MPKNQAYPTKDLEDETPEVRGAVNTLHRKIAGCIDDYTFTNGSVVRTDELARLSLNMRQAVLDHIIGTIYERASTGSRFEVVSDSSCDGRLVVVSKDTSKRYDRTDRRK